MSGKTHYEVLGLKETCSQRDIRLAFVNLSKSYHPDKNSTDSGLHDKFVRINEAYSVLRKTNLRSSYDFTLRNSRIQAGDSRYSDNNEHMNSPISTWRDETIWSMRDKNKDKSYDKYTYYGIKGVSRKPNSWIAAAAFLLMGVGALFHYVAFKHSKAFTVSQLDSRDKRLSTHLQDTKAQATKHGNEAQIKRIFNNKLDLGNIEKVPD